MRCTELLIESKRGMILFSASKCVWEVVLLISRCFSVVETVAEDVADRDKWQVWGLKVPRKICNALSRMGAAQEMFIERSLAFGKFEK